MQIYDELTKDHRQVQSLLESLRMAESADSRRDLIRQVRDALIPHSRAEEAVLYNVLRDMDEGKQVVAHSYQEHMKAEALLRGLQVTETIAVNWQSGVKKLSEELNHHIQEEEGRVFAAAKKVISEDESKTLARAFSELKSKLGSDLVSSQLELIANLMPQRFRKSFASHMQRSGERKAS